MYKCSHKFHKECIIEKLRLDPNNFYDYPEEQKTTEEDKIQRK